ncbi:MAG TPA: hypothetical protein VHP33_39710 [Polyangiaceae bacterium]|nr:hypothetical protein [Polyangiaceae bacterium]
MRVGTLIELALLAALSGCASNQATIGSSVGENATDGDGAADQSPAAAGSPAAPAPAKQAPTVASSNEPEPPPPPDPALVKALVEKTGEAPGVDNPLHLRLEVTPQPAGQLWLVAVVNRGTEAAKVTFDLRHLTLSLQTPDDPKKPRPRWQKKPPARVCKLPEGFGGPFAAEPERSLQPGEGLVQTFDPRLYCISGNGESLLATGQVVTPKLGFAPKPPRVAWKQGKRVEVPVLQSAPFVAEPATLDAAPKVDPEHDPRVKQLVASDLTLTPDLLAGEAEEDPSLPLQLRLLRGSDAMNELTATAVLEVRAKQKTQLYFRRELVSFTVHGPDGIRGCDPQPDDRAPDRQAYSTLGPGQSISATSLLTELCPKYTFGRAGLYLVTARLDAERDGSEFGLSAFTGRLESRREALVRIRTGDFPPLLPPEPLLVKVGQ